MRFGGRERLRVESGSVHLFPGWKASAVENVLHFHIMGRAKGLHLPYQLWPIIAAAFMGGNAVEASCSRYVRPLE